MSEAPAAPGGKARRSWSSTLYWQVLAAVILGVALGLWRPEWGQACKPLGELFMQLIKLLVAPLVFLTVLTGIAGASNLKQVGRIGLVAMIYFEVLTTLALAIGMGVVHWLRPGDRMRVDVSTLSSGAADEALAKAKHASESLSVLPESFLGPFVSNNVLQVLVLAALLGVAVSQLGPQREKVLELAGLASQVVFKAIGLVMLLSPIGAFGAMASTVGKHGVSSLLSLFELMLCFYLTSAAFVAIVLGSICRWIGVSLWQLLRHFRDELLLVLGTSSSEPALPKLMSKLEHLGCKPEVVRLVVPTGYSFNLDGTSIYLTMAALFVAQSTGTELTFGQELQLLFVLLLTSKGAAGVTGSGFVTLTSTLAASGTVPVVGAGVVLGVDRFMSEARAITNFIGNTVATLAVARFERALDLPRARQVLAGELAPDALAVSPAPPAACEPEDGALR